MAEQEPFTIEKLWDAVAALAARPTLVVAPGSGLSDLPLRVIESSLVRDNEAYLCRYWPIFLDDDLREFWDG